MVAHTNHLMCAFAKYFNELSFGSELNDARDMKIIDKNTTDL